jgi:hypothetical protein
MNENDGTYAALMELQQDKVPAKPAMSRELKELAAKPTPGPTEDLITTPTSARTTGSPRISCGG